MKNITQFFAFLAFILSCPALCMEQSWLKKATSNFVNRMLNTTTYQYNSHEHLTSLACIFAMPQSIGQYILYKQRSNMKNFLRVNEANALEEIRKHYNIDPKIWQKQVIEKSQADREFNLQAMREPGNNYNTKHNPTLPIEWVTAIENECKRYNINVKNLNLAASHNENHTFYARARSTCSENNTYIPATIALSIHNTKEYSDIINLNQTACHEMTHITEGHALYITNLTELIAPIPLVEINGHYIKQVKECIKIRKDLQASTSYKHYYCAGEKTADTLIPCDDKDMAQSYMRSKKICRSFGCLTSYPKNDNDIAVLDANWQTAQAIKESRQLYQLIKRNPLQFIDNLKKILL